MAGIHRQPEANQHPIAQEGVTVTCLDGEPVPLEFVAVTVTAYETPLVRPGIWHDLAGAERIVLVVEQVKPPGKAVAS